MGTKYEKYTFILTDEFISKLQEVRNYINYNVENSYASNKAIATIDELIEMRKQELSPITNKIENSIIEINRELREKDL